MEARGKGKRPLSEVEIAVDSGGGDQDGSEYSSKKTSEYSSSSSPSFSYPFLFRVWDFEFARYQPTELLYFTFAVVVEIGR